MATQNSSKDTATIRKPEFFGADKAIILLKQGKRVAVENQFNPDTGKVNSWWMQRFQAGNKNIVAQVSHGSVNNYGNWNQDIDGQYFEVTDEMLEV